MVKYIDYQRALFRWLTYIQVCRYYIEKDSKSARLIVKKTGKLWVAIYYIVWINTLIKATYLFMTYQGWLLDVEFLDKMSIWVYFLMIMEMVQETIIWCRKNPFCDILVGNWILQEELFNRIGEPESMERKIKENDKFLVRIHSVIVVVGCSSLMIQYYTAPKYSLNTYAVFPYENNMLQGIFAAHEFLFMWHAWVNAASSIVTCEIFSVSYTHLFRELAKIAQSLPHTDIVEENKQSEEVEIKKPDEDVKKSTTTASEVVEIIQALPEGLNTADEDPKPPFKYVIESILFDYKKIMLATAEFNNWAGKWMGGTVAALYVQFVSDVFIMIQLLKEPGTDFMAVFFFFQDAFVGMFIMFKMLILMSRVHPASTEFLQQVQNYMKVNMPSSERKYLMKYQRIFKPISAKLGGHITTPKTVPHGIHTLINYYIAAGLWQHPTET